MSSCRLERPTQGQDRRNVMCSKFCELTEVANLTKPNLSHTSIYTAAPQTYTGTLFHFLTHEPRQLQPDSQCHFLEHTVLHRMKPLYTNLHLAHSQIGFYRKKLVFIRTCDSNLILSTPSSCSWVAVRRQNRWMTVVQFLPHVTSN